MMKNSNFLDSHFSENFTIQEAGMKLIPEHRSKIWSKLKSLELRAPIMTTTHLSFTASQEDILGELVILGVSKKFVASSAGQDPWKIYQKLESDIDAQLADWKESRFVSHQYPFPSPNLTEEARFYEKN